VGPEGGIGEDRRGAQRLGIAAVLFTAACSVATADVLVRAAYRHGSEPMSVLEARLVLPAALAWAYCGISIRDWRALPRPTLRVGVAMVAFGLLEIASQFGEIEGLKRIPAALVVLLFALAPVWIALAGWVFWRSRVGRSGVAAIAAALGGTAIVVGIPSAGITATGIAFAALGGFTGACALLLYERALSDWPPQLVLAIGTTVAAVALALAQPRGLSAEFGDGAVRAALVAGSAVGFAVAILLVMVSIQRSSAFVASVSTSLEPVFAAVIAWLALGETLAPHQLAGGGLAVLGLGLALARPAVPSARIPC
jgi:drug/metabolite transporter (DMT)-like permease